MRTFRSSLTIKSANISASAAVLALSLLPVTGVQAQETSVVKFAPGNYGATISGTVQGHDYIDYLLDMKKGQKLFYDLKVSGTNGSGNVFMNLIAPSETDAAIYIGNMDIDTSETIDLPETGVYKLRVYLMGNDKDANKTVGFTMDVSVQ